MFALFGNGEHTRNEAISHGMHCSYLLRQGALREKMPLFMIGLGLGDESDITLKGVEAIKSCSRIFLESYTSILAVPAERLEVVYGKKVEIAYRETVESEAATILEPARAENVAFLVVGDPFGCVGPILPLQEAERGAVGAVLSPEPLHAMR